MVNRQKFELYRRGEGTLPERYWLWPLYGRGLENLGQEGGPIQVPMRLPGPQELLVRHDAVGICFSDTKVIAAGEAHPRIVGRNMREQPVVLGHEVALTVMDVGQGLEQRFHRGQRFIVQADIFYRGVGIAYGYALQGGLAQYNIIGDEVLNGDEGCYLIPMAEQTGYAQGALTEPWACVMASYQIAYRTAWKPGGRVLIAGGPAALPETLLGDPYDPAGPPAEVVLWQVPARLDALLAREADSRGHALAAAESLEAIARGRYDDVVLLGPDPALYEALEPLAANGAVINLVGAGALNAPAQVDVGRLHYDHVSLVGTPEPKVASGYAPIRCELKPGGRLALLGAAGPMGQMHFQRALQAEQPPRLIVATSRVMDRLALLPAKFADLIASHPETRVLTMASAGKDTATFNAELLEATGGQGYDNIIVLAPSAQVVADALAMLAPGGVMNIFAGLPRGTRAPLDLTAIVGRGARLVGSSGSFIGDLRHMLELTEQGTLDPNLSVVAIAGLRAAKEALEGVMHSQFPGKVVVYPQVLDFPLTMLGELRERLPAVYARLGPNESWNVQAEQAFLEEMLP